MNARAPRRAAPALLLLPVEGWVAGEWFEGRWADAVNLDDELRPPWWMDVPPEPEDTAGVMLELMLRAGKERRLRRIPKEAGPLQEP